MLFTTNEKVEFVLLRCDECLSYCEVCDKFHERYPTRPKSFMMLRRHLLVSILGAKK